MTSDVRWNDGLLRPRLLVPASLCGALVIAGCRPASPPATPVTGTAQPGGAKPVTATAAPPIRLGMPAKDLSAQPNLTTKETTIREAGRSFPAIHVSRFGLPLFIAEVRDGKVIRAEIVSERYRTAGGAHVGSKARDLERLFGPGRVESLGPDACATFAKAPGLSFCFRGAARTREWADLARTNPRVQRIIVEEESATPSAEAPAGGGSGTRGG